MKTICIVGAGAAGLISLRRIIASNSENETFLEPTVFEMSDSIGGVWNYHQNESDNIGNPMYAGLRANLPKQMMRFLDFDPDNYEPDGTYVSQQDVLNYLNLYADSHNLNGYIKTNRRVVLVKQRPDSGDGKEWIVTIENVGSVNDSCKIDFDSVIVCNGRHYKRKYPENYVQIKKTFQGTLLHSREYNTGEIFHSKIVVVIGGGPSGIDISLDISKFAKQVYLSLKDVEKQSFSNVEHLQNFRQVPCVQVAKENSVILTNKEEIICDVIVFCTGYDYEFPFLQDGIVEIEEDGRFVSPLHRHMIHRKYPSLCFIGLPYLALPFILFDCQASFYVKWLRQELTLPSEEDMEKEYNDDEHKRRSYGLTRRQTHVLHSLQWSYFQRLAKEAGCSKQLDKFLPELKKVYRSVLQGIFKDPLRYRERRFEILLQDSESMEESQELDSHNLNLKC